MKPYDQYGAIMRRTLRTMYKNHPKPTRVYHEAGGQYEALERDGWLRPIGKRSAMLTEKAVFRLREVMK